MQTVSLGPQAAYSTLVLLTKQESWWGALVSLAKDPALLDEQPFQCVSLSLIDARGLQPPVQLFLFSFLLISPCNSHVSILPHGARPQVLHLL